MKQALVKKGMVVAEDIPAPKVSCGSLLIKVVNSCISAGTEASGVAYSGKPLIKKAMDQPAQIAKVWKMARDIGIGKTIARVQGALDAGQPTGYSVAGVVVAVGEGVKTFKAGDRVSAAGAGLANHAEFVDVPENLVMKIPDGLGFAQASTVTLGGIAWQGVRRMGLTIGEQAVVVGGGILGLLALQLLRVSGVRVCVTDLDEERLGIARELGAEITVNPDTEDSVKAVHAWTAGYGSDAVLFSAATGSSEPLSQSFQMCKRKGKVVLLGVSGMQVRREDMYAKELDFLISTSYGPGRYDRNYEEKGLDYPYGYVRWTENRNMTEYLRLLSQNAIDVERLIHKIYPIGQVSEAFASLNAPQEKPLMVLLDYGAEIPGAELDPVRKVTVSESLAARGGMIRMALVGAGEFAKSMHLPNVERLSKKIKLQAVMSRTGHKAKGLARQYGAAYATTDYSTVLNDPQIDMVLISTRHDSHADLALQALSAGKHVLVEKPLAVTQAEVELIKAFYLDSSDDPKPMLMVGFNRRFSPCANEIRRHTDRRTNPLFINYRMNAGYLPLDAWQHEAGGRLIGEGCHIIDLMSSFTRARLESISTESMTPANQRLSSSDNRSVVLKYADGSVCTILYFAVGSEELPKEYMEVHFDEKTIVMDDYKSLKGLGVKIKEVKSELSQKGQLEELEAFCRALQDRQGRWPIELWDMVQTTEATFAIENSR